jgi:hypothetical protein
MSLKADPKLRPGQVYRTGDLKRYGENPTRLARRLVQDGQLVRLRRGLYAAPEMSRFGAVPPKDEELVRTFLKTKTFVFTGPERWNALGLGTTAMFASPLVYNKKRTGEVNLGGRKFVFRRVAFPPHPTAEWFAVDLLQHAASAGASVRDLEGALGRASVRGELNPERLRHTAKRYGTQRTQAAVEKALSAAVA